MDEVLTVRKLKKGLKRPFLIFNKMYEEYFYSAERLRFPPNLRDPPPPDPERPPRNPRE